MKVDIYQMMGEKPHLIFVKHGNNLKDSTPKSVYSDLGKWGLVRNMNLSPSTTLVGAKASEVIESIKAKGFFSTVEETSSTSSSVGAGIGAGILAASLGLTPIGSAIAAIIAGLVVASNSKEK